MKEVNIMLSKIQTMSAESMTLASSHTCAMTRKCTARATTMGVVDHIVLWSCAGCTNR